MKRDTSQTIWRTVVFAGAMLGPACKSKPAASTPNNTHEVCATPDAKPEPATTPSDHHNNCQIPELSPPIP